MASSHKLINAIVECMLRFMLRFILMLWNLEIGLVIYFCNGCEYAKNYKV